LLIVLAVAATPLPGPAGVPLFLIGFALIGFPGKRRLTARVLRGKPVKFPHRPFALISFGLALAVAVVALPLARSRIPWVAASYQKGPVALAMLYGIAVAAIWLLVRATPHILNLLLRLIARGRHKVRPWLRRHHIRLLPPRWRRRLSHEPGIGPFRLREEILKFRRRKPR
jgi:hypothetical protein